MGQYLACVLHVPASLVSMQDELMVYVSIYRAITDDCLLKYN